jgi:7-cyano-7-deazaguanine reductase
MVEKKYGEKAIEESELELWKNKYKEPYLVRQEFPEYTSKCPRSGYPDFGNIILEYIPKNYIIETRSLKYYYNKFREKYISTEDATNEIAEMLFETIKPKWLKIIGKFAPRGGMSGIIEVEKGDKNE